MDLDLIERQLSTSGQKASDSKIRYKPTHWIDSFGVEKIRVSNLNLLKYRNPELLQLRAMQRIMGQGN